MSQKIPDKLESELKNLLASRSYTTLLNRCGQILKRYPNSAEVWIFKGQAQRGLNQLLPVIKSFATAAKLNPGSFDAHFLLGVSLLANEAIDDARVSLEKALQILPTSAQCYNNLGIVHDKKNNTELSLNYFKKALKLKPEFLDAHLNIAGSYLKAGANENAIRHYNQALNINPKIGEAYFNMGVAYKAIDREHDAKKCYAMALQINPKSVSALNNLASILCNERQWKSAIAVYKRALRHDPTSSKAHTNLARVYTELEDYVNAIYHLERAIEIDSDNPERHYLLANALSNGGAYDAAVRAYTRALTINPNFHRARSHLIGLYLKSCDWTALEEHRSHFTSLGLEGEFIDPFGMIALQDDGEKQKMRAELYVSHVFKKDLPYCPDIHRHNKKIKIGYFSADFRSHPVARLITRTIELHDRNKFHIIGYAIKEPTDHPVAKRLINAFDEFNDVSEIDDGHLIANARNDSLDIAVDLTGHTAFSRSKVFGHRLAPIQINYLGYPGSMGAKCMDYIIADKNLITPEFESSYVEKPIILPHHYQAQDDLTPIQIMKSRCELGLPERGFVWCAINNTYKITPDVFDVWMRLLKAKADSVLWLYRSSDQVMGNLCREASNRDIDPARLIFAAKCPYEEYVANFQCADVYLDTFSYNAGATASDVLRAGLPIITKRGSSYASRMASSLLQALGMPELIANNIREYEKIAMKLADCPDHLFKTKAKINRKLKDSPLFNTQLFVKHLETGYQIALDRHTAGQLPSKIIVEG